MDIKLFSSLLFILVLGFSSCKESKDEEVNNRPNIILIMTDDQGWYDAGFNGNTFSLIISKC